ncbi:MAG TPA: hypothetical protein DC054_19550 [Blastocatellia bacterium]|nr:hypothetical protein [Blastocatellia bacterium]
MKPILVILLISLTFTAAVGQRKVEDKSPKCTLGMDHAPELRGFRLATPQQTVLAKFPGVSIEKPDKFGLARLRLSLIDSAAVIRATATRDKGVQADTSARPEEGSAFVLDGAKFPALKGVRRIELRFIDSRLSFVLVAYDDSIKWDDIDDFVGTVSKALSLPAEWKTPAEAGGEGSEKELRCDAFAISANVGNDPLDSRVGAQLTVEDLAAWKALSKRQNDLTEKTKREADEKRKGFKP